MRKMILAAAALLAIPAVPALAHWAPTQWGMTPAQVIATVPGAKAMKQSADTDLQGLHNLASAPAMDGKVKLTAGFYFSEGTRTLELVDIVADDRGQCADYRALLTARYGAGKVSEEKLDISGQTVTALHINWTDPDSGDSLDFMGIIIVDDTYAICKLMQAPFVD